MQSSRIMSYLKDLCHSIDHGLPLHRFAWRRAVGAVAIPVAIGLASVASGCPGEVGGETPAYAVPHIIDPDSVNEYGAPFEPVREPYDPGAVSEYAAPFEPVPEYGVPFDEPAKPPISEPERRPLYSAPSHLDNQPDTDSRPLESVRRYGAPFRR